MSLKKDLVLLELEKIEFDGNARVLTEEMSEEIDQMNFLIDQMLDFARMDAAISEAPKTAVDFKDILIDTIEAYSLDIQHKKIDIITQVTSDTATVLSREQDLIAICQNLISNALKFSQDKGMIEVRLICRKETVVLSFANTCEPLEESSFTRIFDPFYRIEDNGNPGSGLGLAIVKKTVENLNGSITATPWNQKGICFEVRLPLTRP